MKKTNVKKIFKSVMAAVLCVIMVGALAACKDKETSSGDSSIVSYLDYDLDGVTLGKYKGLELTKDLTVNEAELKQFFNDDLSSSSELNETDSDGNVTKESEEYKKAIAMRVDSDVSVKKYDIINLDYSGYVDAVKFDGGTATDQDLLIGSGTFIDGFEESIIGHKVGTEFDINVTFPENYSSTDLAGKDAVFKIKVNFIYPDYSEEAIDIIEAVYIAQNTPATSDAEGSSEASESYTPPFSTVSEYKAYATEQLKLQKDAEFEENLENEALLMVHEATTIESYPQNVMDAFEKSVEAQAEGYGVDTSTFLSYFYGISTDEEFEEFKKYQVGYECVIAAIIKAEKFTVTDEEFDENVTKFTEEYGYESEEALLSSVSKIDIENKILSNKVLKLIVDEATVVVVE